MGLYRVFLTVTPRFQNLFWVAVVSLITFEGCGVYKSDGRKEFEDTPLSQLSFIQSRCVENAALENEDQELNWNDFNNEFKDSFQIISKKSVVVTNLGSVISYAVAEPESKISCELELQ